MTRGSGPMAARRIWLLLVLPVNVALLMTVGRSVTGPLAGYWPLSAEDGVNRFLAAHRGAAATWATEWFSLLASTQVVTSLTLVCVLALLLVPSAPRWADAGFLAGSVALQSAMFLLVTMAVERPRPGVPHLDLAPPTSSFPSGHVGASVALYGGLAVITLVRVRGSWRRPVAAILLLVPLAVAGSRLYRGMHHPSDVLGGLFNGAVTLAVLGTVLLAAHRRAPEPRGTASAASPRAGRTVVVRHPHGCDAELADRVRAVLDRHGIAEQRWILTTEELPCGELAAELAAEPVVLVVVCGGDGTVRACAELLAGSGTDLAVVPCGTGNLLARNLGLALDPVTALEQALSGDSHGIDVGRVQGDGIEPTRFVVMAGVGFDAAMVQDTSPRLKSRLGWAAYVVSALRHLGDPGIRLTIRLDGGRPLRRRARMAVIGNVGVLQGGLPLLPQARADNGRFDVVLFAPEGPSGWLAAAAHLTGRALRKPVSDGPGAGAAAGGTAGGALEYFSATRVDIHCAAPQPREIDGDGIASGARLSAEIEPGALRVRLPRVLPGDVRPAALPAALPAARGRLRDGADEDPSADPSPSLAPHH
ncbi:diacylglycerol kinase family protein [Streptomyces sp. G-G2]|uniref:diacylglycerol kinase family protein n=1 Tax=Streptomyces sp. G-G2 TaxID=3046201 RepID=UPI0024B9D9E3|nr:diacylglycerol kinase family protein [Streptomyces sp. G-G2]MDJ0384811.1 diacylglycerol kinase family protein [Streptomyces sp. G-G2]